MNIRTTDVIEAIRVFPGLYEDQGGHRFAGVPVSQVQQLLRDAGWRNVPRIDEYDLRKMGLTVTTARYVGGARPKRFCDVVSLAGVPLKRNAR